MHSFYLRSCYVRNEFAQGKLELAGEIGQALVALRRRSVTAQYAGNSAHRP